PEHIVSEYLILNNNNLEPQVDGVYRQPRNEKKRNTDNNRPMKNDSKAEEVDTPVKNQEETEDYVYKLAKKELDIPIDHPLTVVIIGVHGEQKCSLREVDEFLITVGDKTITFRVVVTDAENYAIINKKRTEKKKYISEEESESENNESNKDDDEYKQKNLREHITEECIFNKNSEIETIYICREREKKNFNIGSLSNKQEVQARTLLTEYKDIFMEESGRLEKTSMIQYKIFTEEGYPIKQKFYPLPSLNTILSKLKYCV
ncbi:1432_t:CDS:2, partial [Dentiscutata heterogama]